MKPEFAYAIVSVWKSGDEDVLLSTIRSGKNRCIDNAKNTVFGGGKSWPYIKRRGFRVQKIKITAVRS